MFFHNLGFILPSFQQFLLKRMLVLSHKMILIKNEAALLCITMQERAMGICSYNLVYNFTIQLIAYSYIAFAIKKFSFCGALFKRILGWERGISKRQFIEVVPLLVVFHLTFSKYKGVKMFLLMTLSKSKFFTRVALVSFVQHSCRSWSTRVALVSHLCRSCFTRIASVALVLHLCHSCRTRVPSVWHSCCKLNQIFTYYQFIYTRKSNQFIYRSIREAF